MRTATISRDTKETQITLTLNLDAMPVSDDIPRIRTGLPFFDHMLNAFSCHGRFGLDIDATGDIEVDPHHLIEDVGIVLGEAIREALPAYKGIQRAGSFAFPMDGSLAVVALDLCGRPNLVWNVQFGQFPVGNIDPNLFREFYKGLVDGMRGTLHIHVPVKDNDHHVIEATFKAFARALREAVVPVGSDVIISTKGVLDA